MGKIKLDEGYTFIFKPVESEVVFGVWKHCEREIPFIIFDTVEEALFLRDEVYKNTDTCSIMKVYYIPHSQRVKQRFKGITKEGKVSFLQAKKIMIIEKVN